MTMWCSFQYREFHDVPRSLVVRLPDSVLLLESSFDEGRDDYSDEYELYDRTGARREQCTPGDAMYIEPYRYACVGGRWVRQEPPVR